MRHCSYNRDSYFSDGPRYECRKRVLLSRVCVEHQLERYRYEAGGDGWFSARLDLSNIIRPYVMIDGDYRIPRWASFQVGDGRSDPVASIDFHVPRWLNPHEQLDRAALLGLTVAAAAAVMGRRR